ncbi:MAG: hypothetical protein IPM74_08175 [Crocinitomicaceae bacterium]|nr:hypothetical protein [Crocinitomicaceae bacterium]MBK8925874.1 hypothetical protein [Crocinitomicaceae bacterium]
MKFRLAVLFTGFLFFCSNAFSNVYIRYSNQDSKTYTWDVKIAGVMTKVEFGGNRTSTVTVQGSASECTVFSACGDVRLTNDVKITIKNGCIVIG